MKTIRLNFLVLSLILSLAAPSFSFAVAIPQKSTRDQISEQVPLSVFGHAKPLKNKMPNHFQVLVWNIHKASNAQMLPDFSSLSKFADLALFQEAIDDQEFASKLKNENTELAWALARAFETGNGNYTGVATGSSVVAQTRMGYRTIPEEPVTNTPKTMLLSDYNLENGKVLRVLNVHAINFVGNSAFEIQVQQIVTLMKNHKGPMIVAGDFNTWSGSRKRYLFKSLAAINLLPVELEKHGLLDLDHVFIRDLNVIRKNVFEEIDSSDHKPILVELESI